MLIKRFERLVSFLVSGLFLLFLLFVFCVTIVSNLREEKTFSYFENRNLTAFPVPDKETVGNGAFFDSFEEWCRDHIVGRNTVVRYDTLFNLYVLRRPVVNQTVVRDGLLLPYQEPEEIDPEKIRADAEDVAARLRSHADLTASYGGHFYYVTVPCQYVCFEDEYPFYLNNRADFTKASTDALFRALQEKGIAHLDMRQIFEEKGILQTTSSTVDNHYSIFGALETYRSILERVNADTDYAIPIMTEDDYTVERVPQRYLGSRGRKLLGLWKSEESLYTVTPKVSVPFTRYNWGNDKPGASTVYSLPKTAEEDVLYTMYMGGDISITRILTDRPELPSILIYGDSFTNAVESLIWYHFDSMTSLDFRMYQDQSLESFLAKEQPDIVVCIRDYESLLVTAANGQ